MSDESPAQNTEISNCDTDSALDVFVELATVSAESSELAITSTQVDISNECQIQQQNDDSVDCNVIQEEITTKITTTKLDSIIAKESVIEAKKNLLCQPLQTELSEEETHCQEEIPNSHKIDNGFLESCDGVKKKQNDDGEIVSDSENGGSESKKEINIKKEAKPQKRVRRNELDESPSVVDDEPNTKKSALEYLRSMKFARRDPFGDSVSRDNKGLRLTRSDRSPVQNSSSSATINELTVKNDYDNKRKRFSQDENKKQRYRRGDASPPFSSSTVENVDIQQKRQRSTMYLLRQKESQNSSPLPAQQSPQQFPGVLKNYLPASGQLKQKLDSILSLTDDQVFSLPSLELRALLVYTVEVSVEQERLLTGRKAQLKELDQMIQIEQGFISQIVNELPTQLRHNISDVFPGDNSLQKSAIYTNANELSTPGQNTAQPPPQVNFNVPPPLFSNETNSQPQFTQMPSTVSASSTHSSLPSSAVFSQSITPLTDAVPQNLSTSLHNNNSNALTSITNAVDVSSFGVPISLASTLSASGLQQPVLANANTSSSVNSSLDGSPSNILKVSNLSAPPPNLSAPPPNLGTPLTGLPAPNLSIPPPILAAPPPPVDFSKPPPSAISAATLNVSNNSSPAHLLHISKSESSVTLKTSHSASNLSSLSGALGDTNVLPNFSVPPPTSSNFCVPPPIIPKSISATPASTISLSNAAAALDLSVPPPNIVTTNFPIINTNVTVLPNLSQPPPNLNQSLPKVKSLQNLISSVATSIQQTTPLPLISSINSNVSVQLATPLNAIQTQQQLAVTPRLSSGPVPLMSIEQPPPPGFLNGRNVSSPNTNSTSGIRSLASIVQQQTAVNSKRVHIKRVHGSTTEGVIRPIKQPKLELFSKLAEPTTSETTSQIQSIAEAIPHSDILKQEAQQNINVDTAKEMDEFSLDERSLGKPLRALRYPSPISTNASNVVPETGLELLSAQLFNEQPEKLLARQYNWNVLADIFGRFYTTQAMFLPITGGVVTAATTTPAANGLIATYYTPLSAALTAVTSPNFFATGAFAPIPALSMGGEGPAQLRKLFIGGLNHETTDDQLKDYYSQWGTVVDCIVIRDPATKHSRGFGFVTYATIPMTENAMAGRPHTINGKIVDPKRAIPREQMLPMTASNPPYFLECEPEDGCKLTLSGIHWDFHTVDDLREYFNRYGEVEQVEIVGQPRGFGFVVFQEKTSANKCLADDKVHLINARRIDVKEYSDTDALTDSSAYISLPQGNRSNHHHHNLHWHNHNSQRHQSSSVASHESTNCTPESSTNSDDQMDASAKILSLQHFSSGDNSADEASHSGFSSEDYPALTPLNNDAIKKSAKQHEIKSTTPATNQQTNVCDKSATPSLLQELA